MELQAHDSDYGDGYRDGVRDILAQLWNILSTAPKGSELANLRAALVTFMTMYAKSE